MSGRRCAELGLRGRRRTPDRHLGAAERRHRRITAWVAIVAVPTAVTGFFGQDVLYPGCGENSGFIASVAIMLIVAGALFLVFNAGTDSNPAPFALAATS